MRGIIRALAAAGIAVIAVTACAGHGTPSSHASRARASVSALAASPAVIKAEKAAIRKVTACARSADGLTVSIPAPGAPGTPSVSGVSFHVLAHPVLAVQKILGCTQAGKVGRTLQKCADHVITVNGVGRGVLGKDLSELAYTCLAGQK